MINKGHNNNNAISSFTFLVKLLVLLFASFVTPGVALAESVCAVVKIEIQQELTLERQAFDAVMKINNGLDTLPVVRSMAFRVNLEKDIKYEY